MAEVPIENIIRKAVDQFNDGDMLAARQSCLQALARNPNNSQALQIFGAVNYSGLRDPFREMLLLLEKIGFDPVLVLDIGAYSGAWTRAFKEIFPQAKVLMVEAQAPKEADLAKVKVDLPGTDYVIALLGREERDSVPFYLMKTPYGSTGSSVYEEQTSFDREKQDLPMTTLDRLTRDREEGPCGLLKLDVQGAELDVLDGAPRVLADVEFVFMEVGVVEYNKGAPLFAETVERMAKMGFVVFDLFEQHRLSGNVLFQIDVLFVREGSRFQPKGVLF
ncbi:MAG: FkbM family methyltransferase [Rhodospirillales bacterium]|jgi:FkbM family methyltransferase|nr:FkbM family methyltransferase [Rhodospirillales bacterium]MDP6773687.1 FkbM family methyltransferase [Rhodospirillales bacterium]